MISINEVFCVHGDLSFFIAYFETVLGREPLQKAVSMESQITSKARFCNLISPTSNLVELITKFLRITRVLLTELLFESPH